MGVGYISFGRHPGIYWPDLHSTKWLGLMRRSCNSKGTFMTSAFDPYASLAVSENFGSRDSRIVTEVDWSSPTLRDNVDHINGLPIDHHLFATLISPRGLTSLTIWSFYGLDLHRRSDVRLLDEGLIKFSGFRTARPSPLRLVVSIPNSQGVTGARSIV
ncbi:hypothetical protein BKA70DRAFT_1430452 [Coprinopsis sp. MPI-PUGE-AT-0042]|nr:hypothetical protein BKA70DRAFT_1430452 [Coprinopsis sp. MPI-PUGE-AT-0042]